MKIGILSDTHDRLVGIDEALRLFVEHGVEEIIHCGDWTTPAALMHLTREAARLGLPLAGVLGNRDDASVLAAVNATLPRPVGLPTDLEVLWLERGERRLVVYHGHHKPTLKTLAEAPDTHVLLTGHTHKPLIARSPDKLIINPGSTAFSIPRRKEPRSVALYDTATDRAELLFFTLPT